MIEEGRKDADRKEAGREEGRKEGREGGSSLEGGKKSGRMEAELKEGGRKERRRGAYFWHLRVTHVFVNDHALDQCSLFQLSPDLPIHLD